MGWKWNSVNSCEADGTGVLISKTKAVKSEYKPIVAAINGYCLAGGIHQNTHADHADILRG